MIINCPLIASWKLVMWKFLRLSPSTEKIGCEDNLSLQYSMLASKMVEREEEMQRQLGKAIISTSVTFYRVYTYVNV